jgi:phosphatidylglycerol:prolipoprotein diacylglycerol transferase
MFPYIVLFGRELGLYSIMLLCGIFTAGVYACRMAIKQKYDYSEIVIFMLLLSAGAIIASYLFYVLVNYKNLIFLINNLKQIDSFSKMLSALRYIFGGSIFYGGLLGGLLTGYILIKKNNKNKIFVDIVAVNIPLFHFFGRIGCFLGGCCFGIPSKLGFIYTNNPIVQANGITRFPVQLLEAVFNFFLFLLLNYFYKIGKYKDKLIYVYLLIYATGRFFIEFFRGDEYRGIWLFLSTSQIISILILFVLLIKYILYKIGEPELKQLLKNKLLRRSI